MKRGVYIILFLFVIVMSSPVIADAPLIFQSNQPYNVKIPCVNNGTYCSNSAVCNLTVIYQDGSTIIQNGIMNNQGTYFNYTVNVNLSQLGDYRGTMNCIDNGLGGIKTFSYSLTSTGDNSNWSFWLILAFFSLILVIIAMYSGNEYMMFIASGAILVTGIYSMIYGIMSIANVYTQSIALIIIAIGIFFLVISSLKAIAEASGEKDEMIGGFGPGGEDDYDYFKS